MLKQMVWLSSVVLLLSAPVAQADFGDRVNARTDRRGATVERRFDVRAERNAALGRNGRSARLELRGDRREQYWDQRGDRFDRRWDHWTR